MAYLEAFGYVIT
jgi:hypothetical protein